MRKLEAFLSVRVVTYCIMSNHVHSLLEVPDRELEPLTEKALLELLSTLNRLNINMSPISTRSAR